MGVVPSICRSIKRPLEHGSSFPEKCRQGSLTAAVDHDVTLTGQCHRSDTGGPWTSDAGFALSWSCSPRLCDMMFTRCNQGGWKLDRVRVKQGWALSLPGKALAGRLSDCQHFVRVLDPRTASRGLEVLRSETTQTALLAQSAMAVATHRRPLVASRAKPLHSALARRDRAMPRNPSPP